MPGTSWATHCPKIRGSSVLNYCYKRPDQCFWPSWVPERTQCHSSRFSDTSTARTITPPVTSTEIRMETYKLRAAQYLLRKAVVTFSYTFSVQLSSNSPQNFFSFFLGLSLGYIGVRILSLPLSLLDLLSTTQYSSLVCGPANFKYFAMVLMY